MNTSASKKKTNNKKATDSKTSKELNTEVPISEKDEVKRAEERLKKQLKNKS